MCDKIVAVVKESLTDKLDNNPIINYYSSENNFTDINSRKGLISYICHRYNVSNQTEIENKTTDFIQILSNNLISFTVKPNNTKGISFEIDIQIVNLEDYLNIKELF